MSNYILEQSFDLGRTKSARAKARAKYAGVPAKSKEWASINAQLKALPGLTMAIGTLPPPFSADQIRRMQQEPLLFFEEAGNAAKTVFLRLLNNARKNAKNPTHAKVFYPFSSKSINVRVKLSLSAKPEDVMSALLAMAQRYPGETALAVGETIIQYGGQAGDWIRRGVEQTGKNIEKGVRDTADAVRKTTEDIVKGAGQVLTSLWPFGQYDYALGAVAAGLDWVAILAATGTILTACAALAGPIIGLFQQEERAQQQKIQETVLKQEQAKIALQERVVNLQAEGKLPGGNVNSAPEKSVPPILLLGGAATLIGLYVLYSRRK